MRGRGGIASSRSSAADVICFVLAGALMTALGCGSPGTSCPADAPEVCPSPAPSFSGQVQAIFQTKCGPCHAPGGVKADTPLRTYAQISPPSTRVSALVRIEQCDMPQAGAPQLTEDERLAVLGWLVCKAPNN